jgi:alpha-beta hydrolase superfamily lysophospholipase
MNLLRKWCVATGAAAAILGGRGVGRAEDVILDTPTGKIAGTLTLPANARPRAAVLIIAGSGPTDRDGNNPVAGKNDSLKMLAEGLAAAGYAALRYDKRGIAASAAAGLKEADLRFDTYVDDAVRWADWLRKDRHFSSVIILGHSEGALIAAIATPRSKADALVSLAGAGRPAATLLREQLNGKLPPALAAQSEQILASLVEGKAAADVPPALDALYRPSVQPYLISWLKYDPAKEIAKVTAPTLIIQGTTDQQISLADVQLLAAGNPRARVERIDGMNHVLKSVAGTPAEQARSYGDPTLPLNPSLLPAIVKFLGAEAPTTRP